ncbi:MAG: MraY family glycosyltransferase [Acidobacteriaceae bacterium]
MQRLLPTLFCLAITLSLMLTWAVRAAATYFGWTAPPSLKRHLHTNTTPRLGGVAIFTAFSLSLLLSDALLKRLGLHDFNIGIRHSSLAMVVFASGIVFALGLIDDLVDCSPFTKILVEIAAASLIFVAGVRIGSFPYLGQQFGATLSYIITVAFVVLVTNAFNLIDGMDGLAAGSALFSTVAVGVVAALNHRNPILLIATGLAGVLIGFLRFNFNPASIFLGDSGSLFIGFLLSAAAISGTQKLPTFVAVVFPIMVFAIPMLDATLSILRRTLRGQPIFVADRDHIHHRLLMRGFTQRQAVLLLYAISCLTALLTLLLLYNAHATAYVLITFCVVIILLAVTLDYEDIRELRAAIRRTWMRRRVLSSNIEFRRMLRQIQVDSDCDPLREINRRLAPDSQMQFVVGSHEPRIFQPEQVRWSIGLPVRNSRGERIATVLLFTNADHLPFELPLLEFCGAILARIALAEASANSVVAAAANF